MCQFASLIIDRKFGKVIACGIMYLPQSCPETKWLVEGEIEFPPLLWKDEQSQLIYIDYEVSKDFQPGQEVKSWLPSSYENSP